MNTYNKLISSWKLDQDSFMFDKEYVSKEDFKEFNHQELDKVDRTYQLDFTKAPQPFWGNIKNPSVIFLFANPSIKCTDENYREALLENLKGTPFDFLEKSYNTEYLWEENADALYWIRRFRDFDQDLKEIPYNKYFGEFEFHGYNSILYKRLSKEINGTYLPTQRKQFEHIRFLLSQDNPPLVVIVRKKQEWLKALPELVGNYITVSSSQSAYLTKKKSTGKGNIELEQYNSIIDRIRKDHQNRVLEQ